MENPKSRDRLMNVRSPCMFCAVNSATAVCSRRLRQHFYPFIVADGLNVDAGSFGQVANRYFRSFYFSWRNHVVRHGNSPADIRLEYF